MSEEQPSISRFMTPTDPPKLDATLIADYVSAHPTPLGRSAVDAEELYEYRDGVYQRSPYVLTKRVAAALGARYSSTVLGQVAAHMLNIELPEVGLPELPRGYLEYIVVENGIYWWRDDVLAPHTPALGALTKLPITHDPQAKPHYFLDWLHQVLGDDEELHRHLWEVIGYMMMTGNPFQKVVLLMGEGGNGKGTLLRILRSMLGRENYSSISMHQLVEDRFASSGLYGKIANISGDLSGRYLQDTAIMKEITGGDSISASRKHGHAFEFTPYAVPIFASNEYFRTSDNSIGWRRRWEVIEFTKRVEGRSGFDEQYLLEDIPGIFTYAMHALRRLMERGKFAPPQAAQEATDRLHDAADPFMLWLDEDDGVYRGDDQSSPTDDVYRKYSTWCSRNGYTRMSSGQLGVRLKQLGITKSRPRDTLGRRVMHYHGIGVMITPGDN